MGDRGAIARFRKSLTKRAATIAAALVCLFPYSSAFAAQAPEVASSKYTEVVLLSDRDALAPGERFTLALKQKLAPGWHSYWRNPGAIGMATTIAWTAPDGVEIGEIQWPVPSRTWVGEYVNFGYEDEVSLLVEAAVPKNWPEGRSVELTAKANWLVCKEICIPEAQTFTLTLPVGALPQTDFKTALEIGRARGSLPAKTGAAARYRVDGARLFLEIDAPEFVRPGIEDLFFFPNLEGAANPSAAQIVRSREAGPALAIELGEDGVEGPLPGVLKAADKSGGVLAIALTATPDPTVEAFTVGGSGADPSGGAGDGVGSGSGSGADAADLGAAEPWKAPAQSDLGLGLAPSVLSAALLAFLGGMILNLMPCVFPVLAMKAMGLARLAESDGPGAARERLSHGLAYGGGVLASFLVFAAALLALRSAGVAAGWGFQLQSPPMVAVLAYLMVVVGLNFSGVFEVSGAFAGMGQALTERRGLSGDFFTGVLAAVVAAPCTAPFMGAALGYALTQSAAASLTVFAALALGFAAPIVALHASPAAAKMLPRPGAWMERFRHALAFPIYLAAAWLFWVLGNQVGVDALFAALVGAVALAFALWLLGAGWPSAAQSRLVAGVFVIAALIGAVFALVPSFTSRPIAAAPSIQAGDAAEPFDLAALERHRAANRPVFLNVTADWCVSCKVNEATVLSGDGFKSLMSNADAVYMKADWTLYDERITDFLNRFGRIGVPLYVVFPAGGGDPVVLPQILTTAIVADSLGA